MKYRDRKGRFARKPKDEGIPLIGKMLLGGTALVFVSILASDWLENKAQLHKVVYAAEEVAEEPKPALIEVEIDWSEERIKEEVWSAAAKYNTFPEKMWNVIKCEGTDPHTGKLKTDVQSYHKYTFSDPSRGIYKGEREKSFGLVQIHLPDHNISYEQAIDPIFAIDFMAKNFAEGNARWWSCYKLIY